MATWEREDVYITAIDGSANRMPTRANQCPVQCCCPESRESSHQLEGDFQAKPEKRDISWAESRAKSTAASQSGKTGSRRCA